MSGQCLVHLIGFDRIDNYAGGSDGGTRFDDLTGEIEIPQAAHAQALGSKLRRACAARDHHHAMAGGQQMCAQDAAQRAGADDSEIHVVVFLRSTVATVYEARAAPGACLCNCWLLSDPP